MSRTSAVVLILAACLPSIRAHAEKITTIDPTGYVSGTPLSAPAPGITLSTFTMQQTSLGSATMPPTFTPVLEPVYSYNGFFSSSPTSSSSWTTGGGGYDPSTTDCVAGCAGGGSLLNASLLEISLAKPTSYVSVLQFNNAANDTFIQAFNSSGQLIGSCGGTGNGVIGGIGWPIDTTSGRPGCMSVVNGANFDNTEWQFTLSDPGKVISYILAGGLGNGSQIGTVTVPAPQLPPALWMATVALGLQLAIRRDRRRSTQNHMERLEART